MRLDGKVALITGAGSGIGAAAARLFAREGAQVAALGHGQENTEQVVGEITRSGGEAVALVADVSRPQEMEQAAKRIVDRWGRLDVVFANAGVNGVWAPLEELAPEEWNRTIATNLTGTFLTIKYAAPYLKRQGGSVIITSSINGTRVFSNTGATAYASSKAGQVALAQMLALELAQWHVRVNAICPGAIKTEIDQNTERRDLGNVSVPREYPAGKVPLTRGEPGSADDVARLALFLAADDARHISGTEMWIDRKSPPQAVGVEPRR